jgi:hypothetical protein
MALMRRAERQAVEALGPAVDHLLDADRQQRLLAQQGAHLAGVVALQHAAPLAARWQSSAVYS